MKHSKKQKAYSTSEKIPENMKCPVCYELMLPPIYQCEAGHNICHTCIDNVQKCPLCKGDYGDTRNYFAEDLVNTSTFPCKYEEYGCTGLFHGVELKAHQDGCECQPYRCPELACKDHVGLHQMNQHLERHGFQVMVGDSHLAIIDIQDCHFDKRTEYNPWRISTFNREFYAITSRQKDGYWSFWTWILGPPEEAKKFSAEIVLSSDDKDVIYRGPVHSLRVPSEEIVKGGTCLMVKDEFIKSLRKNGQITCGIRFIEGKNWQSKKVKAAKKENVKVEKQTRKNIQKISSAATNVPKSSITTVVCKNVYSPTVSSLAKGTQKKSSTSTSMTSANQKVSTSSTSTQRPSTVSAAIPKPKTSSSSRPKTSGAPSTSTVSSAVSKLGYKVNKILADMNRPKTAATTARSKKRPAKLIEDSGFIISLKDSLRCPGCQEIITPPVYQCCIGHNICHTCRNSRNDCPLCRAPIGTTRNFFAEELLYKAVQKCRYHGAGCKVSLPVAQIRLHEVMCSHAPFECPFNTCHQQFAGKDLLEHLKSHQLDVFQRELSVQIPIPKANTINASTTLCSIPSIIQYNGIGFYPVVIHEHTGLWAFWVSSHEHGKHQYEIIIKRQFKTLVFHAPVVSVRLTQDEVKASGHCLITHDRVMKAMKGTNGKFDFAVRVISSDGKSKIPESFAIPSFYGEKAEFWTEQEQMKFFASTKTSVNPADDDEEEDTVEGIFNIVLSEEQDGDNDEDGEESFVFSLTGGSSGFTLQPYRSAIRRPISIRERRQSSEEDDLDPTPADDTEDEDEQEEILDSPQTSEESFPCPNAPTNSLEDTSAFDDEDLDLSESILEIQAAAKGKGFNDELYRSKESRLSEQALLKSLIKSLRLESEKYNHDDSTTNLSEKESAARLTKPVKQHSSSSGFPVQVINQLSSSFEIEHLQVAPEPDAYMNHTTFMNACHSQSSQSEQKTEAPFTPTKSLSNIDNSKKIRDPVFVKSDSGITLPTSKSGSSSTVLLRAKSSEQLSRVRSILNNNSSVSVSMETQAGSGRRDAEESTSDTAIMDEFQENQDAFKPKRSCLKVTTVLQSETSSTEDLASRSKQLHVKFADLETSEPVSHTTGTVNSTNLSRSNITTCTQPSPAPAPAENSSDESRIVWPAESDLTPNKIRSKSQQKKRNKKQAKLNKRSLHVGIGKRKGVVSLLGEDANDNEDNDNSSQQILLKNLRSYDRLSAERKNRKDVDVSEARGTDDIEFEQLLIDLDLDDDGPAGHAGHDSNSGNSNWPFPNANAVQTKKVNNYDAIFEEFADELAPQSHILQSEAAYFLQDEAIGGENPLPIGLDFRRCQSIEKILNDYDARALSPLSRRSFSVTHGLTVNGDGYDLSGYDASCQPTTWMDVDDLTQFTLTQRDSSQMVDVEEVCQACQVGSSLMDIRRKSGPLDESMFEIDAFREAEVTDEASEKSLEAAATAIDEDEEVEEYNGLLTLSKSMGNLADGIIKTTYSAAALVKRMFGFGADDDNVEVDENNNIIGGGCEEVEVEDAEEYFDVDDPTSGTTSNY